MAVTAARPRRSLLILALSLIATFGVLFGSGTVVYASPSPGEIETQIDAKWNELEPIIEKYNAVHAQVAAGQAQVDALMAKIKPLQTQVDLAMTRVGALSAQLYEMGPDANINAMLSAGTAADFIDQVTTLDAIATEQTNTVSDASTLSRQLQAQLAPIKDKQDSLTAQDAQLKAQADEINSQLADLNKLRLAAYGSGSGTGNLRPAACPYVYDGSPGAKAADFACKQIGKKYVWGADGPDSYDCSGLTEAAWKYAAGINLPHNAYEQKHSGNVTLVSKDQLKPGDLIFMYSDVHHVTIYVGGGWDVAAPTYGEPVQMQQPFSTPGRINSYGRPHS